MIQILLPVFFLSVIGIFNLFGIKQSLAFTQISYTFIGFFIFLAVKKVGRTFFVSNEKLFFAIFIFILAITYVIGIEVRGSKRWIDLYFFNFQSSEIFKPFFVLFFADFFTRDIKTTKTIMIFLKGLFLMLLPALIIFKQPDLGNASVFFIIFVSAVLFSDMPKKYILYFFLVLFITIPIGWSFMKEYQKDRIVSFFNPHIDRQGTAYNMTQAIITVGSGKFLGRGLGLGTQSRLFFLPENHTDFAFSSLVEQFGFLGGFFTVLLYLILVLIIMKKTANLFFQRDEQSKKQFLYCIGFLSYFVFQISVNVGMNLGIFPITGIALPFISFGGSSFVATMIGMALLP